MKSEFKNIWDIEYDHVEQSKLLAAIKSEVVFENIARSILRSLSGQPNGLTTVELASRCRCRRQRFLQTMKRLVELEKVYKSKIGRCKKPFRYRLLPWN